MNGSSSSICLKDKEQVNSSNLNKRQKGKDNDEQWPGTRSWMINDRRAGGQLYRETNVWYHQSMYRRKIGKKGRLDRDPADISLCDKQLFVSC